MGSSSPRCYAAAQPESSESATSKMIFAAVRRAVSTNSTPSIILRSDKWITSVSYGFYCRIYSPMEVLYDYLIIYRPTSSPETV